MRPALFSIRISTTAHTRLSQSLLPCQNRLFVHPFISTPSSSISHGRIFANHPSQFPHSFGNPNTILSKMKSKLRKPSPMEFREYIYTIPNLITFARLSTTPVLAYLICTERYTYALGFLVVSSISDVVDGYIARRFKMHTILGSILDPMADKVLMTTLTISLGYSHLISWPLAFVIVGRDAGLILSSFIVRYKSLPNPKTMARFWDFTLPSAEVRPTMISKVNTGLQLICLGTALSATSIPWISDFWINYNIPFQCLVAATTIWSGLSYVFSKDAVRYFKPSLRLNRKTSGKTSPPKL